MEARPISRSRVVGIEPDVRSSGLSYAQLSEYLPFDTPVPWIVNDRYAEEALRGMPKKEVGVYLRGRSVRRLSEWDFADLVGVGFGETLDRNNADRWGVSQQVIAQCAASLRSGPIGERARNIERILTNRVVRDASFRRSVNRAYDSTCAVTRLRIFDRNGRAEAQAAHIWAVSDGGPDVVQNGIALCSTVHWLFDRHLISISDDYRLLIAEEMVPGQFRSLVTKHGEKIWLPTNAVDRPHPGYLAKHRENFTRMSGNR